MKKLALTALTLLSCEMAYALPLSNPIGASLYTEGMGWTETCLDCCGPFLCWLNPVDLEIGFYGDYVFNRNLQVAQAANNGGCVQTTTLFTSAGVVTFNMWEWVDIYVVMGSTHLDLTSSSSNFTSNSTSQFITSLDFDPTFSWSVGGRASVLKYGCFGVGIEGQYFRTRPHLNAAITEQSIIYFNDSNTSIYSEWQIGIGASYSLSTRDQGIKFVPYAGVKWAGVTLNLANQTYTQSLAVFSLPNLQNSKLWGVAVGATVTMHDTIGFTVEGRWADETAVYVSGQLCF